MTNANLFSHPEIELRSSLSGACVVDVGHRTSVDLLEVYPQKVSWKEGLDHEQLLRHFEDEDAEITDENSRPHPLRIFFVDDLNFRAESPPTVDDPGLHSTAQWLRKRFGVAPIFFDCLKSPRHGVTIGNGSFIRKGTDSKRIAVDGLYRYSAELTKPPQPSRAPVHVWFSYGLVPEHGSTYVVHQCPEDGKQIILSCANGPNFQSLLRPLAIDIFLAEDCVYKWVQRVSEARTELRKYEEVIPQDLNHDITANAVETLYQVSQLFQIIRDILADLKDQFEYLTKVTARLHDCEATDDRSVIESLDFLQSKNQILTRWVSNYTERTEVQINRFFNHATQKDSAINLNISELTSKIAVSTQRDSSAMITMAAVTMFFLPGTFIAALFSMVFFNSSTNAAGQAILSVAPQWWLFPVVTIPLTILVFIVWILWRRFRDQRTMDGLVPHSSPTVIHRETSSRGSRSMDQEKSLLGRMA